MQKMSLDKKIMEKIKKDKIKMRPKFVFVAEKIILVIGLVLSVIISIILINLALYIIKNNGAMEFLEFGREGWAAFWEAFPYGFLIWTAIFIGLTYLTFRQFDFSYKKPSFQFIIMILATGIGGGLLLSESHANEVLQGPATKNNIPIISHAYRSAEPKVFNSGTFVKVENVYDGYVITKLPNGKILVIKTNNNLGKNLNNVVVEGSKQDIEYANRQISEADKRFSEFISQQQAMIAQINKMRQEQLQKLENLQYKSGQVLKIIGKQNSNNFETYNIAPVKSPPKIFASEEN